METRPKFKNSFGVSGTKGEMLHFREIVEDMGWKFQGNYAGGCFLIFKAGQEISPPLLKLNHYWEQDHQGSYPEEKMIHLSTPEGWQRALYLAEEKEEEVPEYVEWNDQKDMIYELTVGKTYKLLAIEHGNKYYVVENNNGCKCQYGSSFFKPSTAEAYARQELLEEAKKREQPLTFESAVRPLIKFIAENYELNTSVMVTSAGAELLNGCQVFSTQEYLK